MFVAVVYNNYFTTENDIFHLSYAKGVATDQSYVSAKSDMRATLSPHTSIEQYFTDKRTVLHADQSVWMPAV